MTAAFLLFAAPLLACSCASERPVAEQFVAAEVVFAGRVEKVRDRYGFFQKLKTFMAMVVFDRDPFPNQGDHERCCGYEVEFAVQRMWSGPGRTTIKVLTARGGGDCGYPFKEGQTYLVYAYDIGEGETATDVCTRTRPLGEAAEDLRTLSRYPQLKLRR